VLVYQKPYPGYYDNSLTLEDIEFPSSKSLVGKMVKPHFEYVGQFILQCGETSANDALRLRKFLYLYLTLLLPCLLV
jgi:hypothetical protein